MLDAIPIVKKTCTPFDKLYDVFPCLVVGDWAEVTWELLESRLPECQGALASFKAQYPRWWSDLDSIMSLLDRT